MPLTHDRSLKQSDPAKPYQECQRDSRASGERRQATIRTATMRTGEDIASRDLFVSAELHLARAMGARDSVGHHEPGFRMLTALAANASSHSFGWQTPNERPRIPSACCTVAA